MMPIPSSTLIDTLHSYLEGLEEAGLAAVALQAPFAAAPPAEPPERPRQQPAAVPPVEPPIEKTILPPAPAAEPVVKPVAEKLIWCTLMRMAACDDQMAATDSAVVLVTGAEECCGQHGALLQQMLKAAGYEMLGTPMQWTHPGDLAGAGSRILVMGNQALQAVSTAGMDLKIVRGMWQTTPFGKLISTYPPSALHDNPTGKKAVWQDLKNLLKDLSLEVPAWTLQQLKRK